MRLIPVGYITKPVSEVQVGDVLRYWGRVLDIQEEEGEEFYDEENDETSTEILFQVSTPSIQGGDNVLRTSFYYFDQIELVIYVDVDNKKLKRKKSYFD